METTVFSHESQDWRFAKRNEDRMRRGLQAKSIERQQKEKHTFGRPSLFGPPIKVSHITVHMSCTDVESIR